MRPIATESCLKYGTSSKNTSVDGPRSHHRPDSVGHHPLATCRGTTSVRGVPRSTTAASAAASPPRHGTIHSVVEPRDRITTAGDAAYCY